MKRILTGLLATLMLLGLTACGNTEPEKELRQEGLWYDATGISPDASIFTMNGREVPAGRFFYWLTYTCDYVNGYYQASGMEVDWNETMGDQSLQAYVMQTATENTALYETIEVLAAEHGCAVTEADLGAISMEWDAMVEQYGSEEAYLKGLATMGLDKASAQQMAADQFLYSHLYELYCEEGSSLSPSQADLDAFTTEQNYLSADHILIFSEGAAEEDMARCKALAEDALAEVMAAENPAAAFAGVAEKYSDEDRSENPTGYTYAASNSTMPEAFTNAALQLAENQVSQVLELNGGCCIILRKPLDQEFLRMEYFDHIVQTTAQEAEIVYSEELKALTVPEFYEQIKAARAAMETNEAAEPETK